MEREENESKIINVFFESNIMDKDKPVLELHDLKNIFKVFGKIRRIIIFDRREMIKAFIEFETVISANAAISTIHGSYINNFGECRVTKSDKKKLELKNTHIEFIDYTTNKSNQTNSLKKSAYEFEVASRKSTEDEGFKVSNEFKGIKSIMNSLLKNENFIEDEIKLENVYTEKFEENNLNLENTKKKQYSLQEQTLTHFKKNEPIYKPNSLQKDVVPKQLTEKSKVVVVSNLQDLENVEEIQKLFGCFGDINKILFMTNKHNAFIEYTSFPYAENCFINMNEQTIIKSTLVVSFSRSLNELDLRKNMRSPNAKLFNQALKVPNEMKRFLNNYQTSINPPSKFLLALAKKTDWLTADYLKNYFDNFIPCKDFQVVKSDSDILKIKIEYHQLNHAIFIMAKCGFLVIKDSKLILFFV
jgi:hypothetical protein